MIGIDEVGRGCLAGPLLVVAARQKKSRLPRGLADSKILTRQMREKLYPKLTLACDFGEGWVSPNEIDQFGLTGAMRLGVARALENLGVLFGEEVVMDGPINYLSKRYFNCKCLIDADANVKIVSAASVYAKVTRDYFMRLLAEQYPGYGFETHVGYSTELHRLMLKINGPIDGLHRRLFQPVRAVNLRLL